MASIGSVAVAPDWLREGTANRAVGILIPKGEDLINPHYLSAFFSTNIGIALLDTLKKGGLQQRINLSDLGNLQIPLPPIATQNKIASIQEKGYQKKFQKEAEARTLLDSIDNYLLGELGIQMPSFELATLTDRIFNSSSLAVASSRFDPHFHHPDFSNLVHSIRKTPHESLGQLVAFSHETWDRTIETQVIFNYIEISGVDLQTGEITATETSVAEAPSRAQMVVRANDILVSLTRPHRGAIAVADASLDGCIASTGFAVLRQLQTPNIDREFLWNILRSKICLRQMLQRSSGGNYPAITETELRRIVLPTPSPKVQSKIVAEIRQRQGKAKQLRAEGAQELEQAKQEIERIILGEQA